MRYKNLVLIFYDYVQRYGRCRQAAAPPGTALGIAAAKRTAKRATADPKTDALTQNILLANTDIYSEYNIMIVFFACEIDWYFLSPNSTLPCHFAKGITSIPPKLVIIPKNLRITPRLFYAGMAH